MFAFYEAFVTPFLKVAYTERDEGVMIAYGSGTQ